MMQSSQASAPDLRPIEEDSHTSPRNLGRFSDPTNMINVDRDYPAEATGPYSAAVLSVGRRGFHQFPPEIFGDSLLSAQIAWIVAEAAEYETARREQSMHEAAIELADVAVVAAQIAWLIGHDPDELMAARYIKLPGTTLLQAVGQVCHMATRCVFCAAHEIASLWEALSRLQALLYTIAAQKHGMAPDALDDLVRQKAKADEGRGKLHGRGGETPSKEVTGALGSAGHLHQSSADRHDQA